MATVDWTHDLLVSYWDYVSFFQYYHDGFEMFSLGKWKILLYKLKVWWDLDHFIYLILVICIFFRYIICLCKNLFLISYQ